MNNLIDEYIKLGIAHGEATLEGNSKYGNKIYSKMMKLINDIKLQTNDVKQQFYDLMYHENDSVKMWTAVTLVRTFEKEALEVLKNIKDHNDTIIGFSAKTTIDVWKRGMLTNQIDWNTLSNP